jgi:sugar O-acyltransferase (sialic acid O-acetyltransferase NeuD family)
MRMKPLGIFGASGCARDVADIAWELGYRPVYITRDETELKALPPGQDAILESSLDGGGMEFAIGIGENRIRQRVAERYGSKLRFINLIHPSATFGYRQREAIERQQGVIVCAGVRFTNNIRVGDFTIFNLNATIAHDVIVEDFANLAPGANISGNVHIGARCWIGTGAVINQGANDARLGIGADTMIGSGAVVISDCEPNAVYVGVPAKRIK